MYHFRANGHVSLSKNLPLLLRVHAGMNPAPTRTRGRRAHAPSPEPQPGPVHQCEECGQADTEMLVEGINTCEQCIIFNFAHQIKDMELDGKAKAAEEAMIEHLEASLAYTNPLRLQQALKRAQTDDEDYRLSHDGDNDAEADSPISPRTQGANNSQVDASTQTTPDYIFEPRPPAIPYGLNRVPTPFPTPLITPGDEETEFTPLWAQVLRAHNIGAGAGSSTEDKVNEWTALVSRSMQNKHEHESGLITAGSRGHMFSAPIFKGDADDPSNLFSPSYRPPVAFTNIINYRVTVDMAEYADELTDSPASTEFEFTEIPPSPWPPPKEMFPIVCKPPGQRPPPKIDFPEGSTDAYYFCYGIPLPPHPWFYQTDMPVRQRGGWVRTKWTKCIARVQEGYADQGYITT